MKFIFSFIVDNLVILTCYTQLATGCATGHIDLFGTRFDGMGEVDEILAKR